MSMVRVTAAEFQKAPGVHSDHALREPVTITKHGRDHLVILSAAEFARLMRRDRKVGAAEDMPAEALEAFANAKVPDEYRHLDALMDD